MVNKFKLFDIESLKILHSRVFFSILIFIFVYFVSIYRISEIMLFSDEIKIKNQVNAKKIRGNIFDTKGRLLATTIKSKSLSINPSFVKNKKKLAEKLSNILDLDLVNLETKLTSNKKFIWIKRNISPIEYQSIINLGEINIKTHNEIKRIYPYKNASSHIVGHVDIDQLGQSGIERFYNDKLDKSENIFLTLDIDLQQMVRKNLSDTIKRYKADSGLAVIMNIKNGNILSSVSLPDYNPEKISIYEEKNKINRVIQSNYEMGSTFKPITAIMAYDLDIIKPNMIFDVTKEYKGIGDHNHFKEDGMYNVEKIIVESSNIGTAQIATLTGKNNQNNFFQKLGFNNKINLQIKETAKPLGNKNNWGSLETATIGFGHGFSITPLHLIKAYATLSNNGNEVHPTLIFDKKNKINKKILIKENSSKFFLSLLNAVIVKTKFTGPRVKIEGYEIGGKTGTTELLNPKGGYFKDRNLTSFIGVFPISDPKYVVYTAVEYPKQEENSLQKMTGAVVNAPLVKKIITDMINLLNIPKNKNTEFLKADTKSLYKILNVPI